MGKLSQEDPRLTCLFKDLLWNTLTGSLETSENVYHDVWTVVIDIYEKINLNETMVQKMCCMAQAALIVVFLLLFGFPVTIFFFLVTN